MRTVRNTVNTGRTVVCTIHQPSIDIFEVQPRLDHISACACIGIYIDMRMTVVFPAWRMPCHWGFSTPRVGGACSRGILWVFPFSILICPHCRTGVRRPAAPEARRPRHVRGPAGAPLGAPGGVLPGALHGCCSPRQIPLTCIEHSPSGAVYLPPGQA